MVEKRVGKAGSPAALAEIRYLLSQERTLAEIAAILGLNRQTVHRRVKEHALSGELAPAEAGAAALVHALRQAGRDLARPDLSEARRTAAEARLERAAKALARLPKQLTRSDADMVEDDTPKRRRIEDMSRDELYAYLVKLVLGVEAKSRGELPAGPDAEPGDAGPAGAGPVHGAGPDEPEAP